MMRLIKSFLLFVAGLVTGRKAAVSRPPVVHVRKAGWRLFLNRVSLLAALVAVAGALVVITGLVPIAASSGHWAITRWFLEFSMSRSVSTHSLRIDPPSTLDDEALVVRGAGHYETGCRPCHGGVERQPVIALQMTPTPPHLPPEIARWGAAELFYIVKHGVKFTGMPAWPALERDDEVWAMVAFLQRLPNLTGAEYQDLVYGDLKGGGDTTIEPLGSGGQAGGAPSMVAERCARCHGQAGSGRDVSAFPRLASQKVDYLYASLVAYAQGERHSGIMEPVAAAMTESEMEVAARFFAGASLRPGLVREDSTGVPAGSDRGRAIALEGVPERNVASCVDCHGPGGEPRNPFYPLLAGQFADYIIDQLELFQKGHRGGTAFAPIMHPSVHRLTPDEMRDVAAYFESLGE